MFGKLSLEAIPYHEPIVMVTLAMIALGGIAVVGLITYFRKWTYLWSEWLTTVDHKKIGVMYIIVALIMLLRGFAAGHAGALLQAVRDRARARPPSVRRGPMARANPLRCWASRRP